MVQPDRRYNNKCREERKRFACQITEARMFIARMFIAS
jgi:hypothetical protein